VLQMTDVTLRFGGRTVFDNLSLTLSAGEMVAVETAVLDGGTSLLKLAAGLLPPTSGKVLFEQQDMATMTGDALFASTCMAFESGGLLGVFTNFNNIAFPMLYHTSLAAPAIKERIVALASELDLLSVLAWEPHQLNDVQTRLMNVLRALVFRPRLILLDEPQSGMSKEWKMKLLSVVKQQMSEHGMSVLMTVSAGDEYWGVDRRFRIHQHRLSEQI